MEIAFSPVRPEADTLVFAVPKGGFDALPLSAASVLVGGAAAARFTGEAGSSFESFVDEGGKVLRVVLVGTGAGGDVDFERAGAALTARLATSGAVHAAVEFVGAARRRTGGAPCLWRIAARLADRHLPYPAGGEGQADPEAGHAGVERRRGGMGKTGCRGRGRGVHP